MQTSHARHDISHPRGQFLALFDGKVDIAQAAAMLLQL